MPSREQVKVGTDRLRWLLVATLALCLWPTNAAASTAWSQSLANRAACPTSVPYPGDSASQSAKAAWMAHGAQAAGLPRELPVMAALVESNMQNLSGGDGDSVGYFAMRKSIWNTGPYAGYPDNPDLQLRWFTDQATEVRRRRLENDQPDPLPDESRWGEWIADVDRPAQQNRGRYQLRLAEARQLVGPPCEDHVEPPSGTDTTPPELTLSGKATQRLRASVKLELSCDEACSATATGKLVIPGVPGGFKLREAAGDYAVGGDALTLSLRVPRAGARAAKKALRSEKQVKARIQVLAEDAAGFQSVEKRAVKLGP